MNTKHFFIITAVLVLLVGFYTLCINHVPANSVGVQFDAISGEIATQPHPGFYVTHPFVKATSVSTLAMSVHVPSNAKVINTKVVRLRPDKVLEFVRIQGFSYDLGRGLGELLMGYAFSGQQFSFLEIIQEGGLESFGK